MASEAMSEKVTSMTEWKGKTSKRREKAISDEDMDRRWNMAFKVDNKRKKVDKEGG